MGYSYRCLGRREAPRSGGASTVPFLRSSKQSINVALSKMASDLALELRISFH